MTRFRFLNLLKMLITIKTRIFSYGWGEQDEVTPFQIAEAEIPTIDAATFFLSKGC